VCNRRSEISAFVEKKTGLDGSRTLIHAGFCGWCNAGSIFMQDISMKRNSTLKRRKGIVGTPLASRGIERLPLQFSAPRKRSRERQFIGRFKSSAGRNATGNPRKADWFVL